MSCRNPETGHGLLWTITVGWSVQAIFLTYGCMDQAGANQIAEMLGFQPALVLPQLQKHIVEGNKASQTRDE